MQMANRARPWPKRRYTAHVYPNGISSESALLYLTAGTVVVIGP